jgi:beta-galactosidase GanA
LVERSGRFALLVDGSPFLILGAQANNSSNYPAMLPKVWPSIAALHANTLEMPVAWEQIEPSEGQFDFSWPDALLREARAHRVRLVLLWFGAYKNTSPSYAPSWVKTNNDRFPRLTTATGERSYALSPLSEATLAADSRAFAALMDHLREADAERTVILVQVENETGTYGSVRDYSPAAQKLFEAPVPQALLTALHKAPGTWKDVFGSDADEDFHAWSIASYVEGVARAGKARYPLPMYVNAALRDPLKPQDPSTYASGGPTFNVLDIWKATAPHIAFAAPDFYDPKSDIVAANIARYKRADNALMDVEIGNDAAYARYFFAILGNQGLGFSPFGIDTSGYSNFPLGARTIDAQAIAPFAANYALVGPWSREWAKLSFEGPVWGAAEADDGKPQALSLGRWTATVSFDDWQFGFRQWYPQAEKPKRAFPSGGVLVAQLAPDVFLVTGRNARVSFDLSDKGGLHAMFDRVEEVHMGANGWVVDRVWNGDQTDYGLNFTELPQVLRVRLATY